MTVVLIGVGVDKTNSSPYPWVYKDGSFEYVPIPEAQESATESTYDTFARIHEGGSLKRVSGGEETLSSVLEEISPEEGEGQIYTDDELASHPVHHDPNFQELTYGEVKGSNRKQITELSPSNGDILAFYTGLRSEGSEKPYRYVIGYFTVEEIVDFTDLVDDNPPTVDGDRVRVPELESPAKETVERLLKRNRHNAHAKRFEATGTIHRNLLIAAGTEPGGLLERAVPISQSVPGGYAFTEELESRLNVQSTKPGRDTGFLGGFKKPHRLGISGEDFMDFVSS